MVQRPKWDRKWADQRNAVGFAATCARLALPFYRGDRRSVVVVAIEIAEDEQINATDAYAAANALHVARAADASGAADAARVAAYAAGYAADITYANAANAADDAIRAAVYASRAGVCDSELQIAFARWVTRDLSGGQDFDTELRQAAGAAIIAGDENLAKELLAGWIYGSTG